MSWFKRLKESTTMSELLSAQLWDMHKAILRDISSLDDLSRSLSVLTGKSDFYSKLVRGEVTDLEALTNTKDLLASVSSSLSARLGSLQETSQAYYRTSGRIPSILKKEIKGTTQLARRVGWLRLYTSDLVDTQIKLRKRMYESREASFGLLGAMFGLHSISKLVGSVWETLIGHAFDMEIVSEDFAWALEDLADVLGEPLAIFIEDTGIIEFIEKIAEAISKLPTATILTIGLVLTGTFVLAQVLSIIADMTVAFYGLRAGFEWMMINFPLAAKAVHLFNMGLWGTDISLKSILLSLGLFITTLTLGMTVLNLLEGPMRTVASAIMLLAGVLIAGAIAWQIFHASWSLGSALPAILAAVGLAVAGGYGLVTSLQGIATAPSLQKGGIIKEGGMAILHTGEEVRPATALRREETHTPTSVTVIFQGPVTSREFVQHEVIPEVVKAIDKQLKRS